LIVILGIEMAAPCLALWAQQLPTAASQQNNVAAQDQSAVRSNGSMTGAQGDAILKELRQIRELLERQQPPRQVQAGCDTSPRQVPSARLQMHVGTKWHSIGRDDAPVTIVEFVDLQCPFCQRFQLETFAKLKLDYIDTGKVRFVSRDLPLSVHAYAKKAAEAVRCADDQGKYWEMRDAVLAAGRPPVDDEIFKAAARAGLDIAKFQTCLDSEGHRSEVEADVSEAAQLQITGTPTFLVASTAKDVLDGVRIGGAVPYSVFKSKIDELLLPAGKSNTGQIP
jgi:protein-disulfide isomerase